MNAMKRWGVIFAVMISMVSVAKGEGYYSDWKVARDRIVQEERFGNRKFLKIDPRDQTSSAIDRLLKTIEDSRRADGSDLLLLRLFITGFKQDLLRFKPLTPRVINLALIRAVEQGRADIVELLFEDEDIQAALTRQGYELSPNLEVHWRGSLLHIALQHRHRYFGYDAVVVRLIDYGADPNRVPKTGVFPRTPFSALCGTFQSGQEYENEEYYETHDDQTLFQLFLEHGASPMAQEDRHHSGFDLLRNHRIDSQKKAELLNLMAEYGFDVAADGQDERFRTWDEALVRASVRLDADTGLYLEALEETASLSR